jgi:hypothetical protein
LCLLGLIDSGELATTERALIGSREIRQKERLLAEQCIRSNADRLPASVLALCRQLLEAGQDEGNGFRKMNVPGLTYRYFADMKAMFLSVGKVLHGGGRFALVVGRNRTSLGSQTFVIETPMLLATVAESLGYRIEEILELNAYQRFGLHQKNGITTEQLVIVKRPSK